VSLSTAPALVGLAALTVVAHWLLVPPRARPAFLALASVVLVALLDPVSALAGTLCAALVLLCAPALAGGRSRRGRLVLASAVALLIGSLCLLKYGPPLTGGSAPRAADAGADTTAMLLPLGFSFVVFRSIHVLVELSRGRLAVPRPSDLLGYLLFFPTFLAGPLERFPRFVEPLRAPRRFDPADLRAGLLRILVGAFRKIVLAELLAQHVRPVLGAPDAYAPGVVLLAVYGAALWLYMDFAGYTDIALGLARLLGFRLVENFDRPFLAASIAAFWRRWHISLYAFIRDYFFLPLFGTRASRVKTWCGVICTMVVFMLWHGAEWRWLVLGLFHGGALVVWSLVQDAKPRRPRLRRALASPAGVAACWLLTQHVVAFGFLLFFFDLGQVGAILTALAGR